MSGTVVGLGDTVVNKTGQKTCIHGAYILITEAIPIHKMPSKWGPEKTFVSGLEGFSIVLSWFILSSP